MCLVLGPSLQGGPCNPAVCPEKRNEAVRGVEHKCDGERLGEVGFLSVEKRRLREDHLPLSNYVTDERLC